MTKEKVIRILIQDVDGSLIEVQLDYPNPDDEYADVDNNNVLQALDNGLDYDDIGLKVAYEVQTTVYRHRKTQEKT